MISVRRVVAGGQRGAGQAYRLAGRQAGGMLAGLTLGRGEGTKGEGWAAAARG